ncbi:hypothetical protein [Blastomonas fulva]|uniref:Uncharacterized protein n=1 Tax=Blastomonas fulva TaxID=1550728 RepID=A0ABN5B8Q1_9SPHN|nr:hypothetical protein [Blastomonas fulva]ASR52646.1 hypothetical protein B5J99_15235 [Blastomonas fulva]
MQGRASILTVALALCAGQAAAQPSNTPPADLSVRMGDTVAMFINNQPVRFRLAPDAVSVPTVNADVAEKVGLKPSMIGYVYLIGPVKIALRTDNVKYRAGTTSFKSRTAFSDRKVAAAPMALPALPHSRSGAPYLSCGTCRRAIRR